MTKISAKHLGAEKLFAVGIVSERLAKAKEFGASSLNASFTNIEEEILYHSNGHSADDVTEVVGSESALKLAVNLLRPGGIISSAGVHTSEHFPFSPGQAYNKNLAYNIGRCPAPYYAEKLLREKVVQHYTTEDIITHRFTLQEGSHAYKIFDKKIDNCIKAILIP